ncbi:MAG: endonuclease MutS2 [Clostridiales bacterium]|nr:endonuclease MutS2 [Clostridiales bacterium]
MRERNLRVLEFTKIREMLKEYAGTELGMERIDELMPSGDIHTVEKYQAQTEEANTIISMTGGSPVQYFTDVRPQLRIAAAGGTLSMRGLLDVADVLRAARSTRTALVTEREDTPLLTDMGSRLATNRTLEEDIYNAILSEEEMADRASAELYDIRRHIRILNDKVREKLNTFIRNPNLQKYLQDSIVTMRNGRYVIPVRAECRQFVPGLVHDQSGSGSTLFIEPMVVVEIGNDLKQWLAKEQREIERILSEFSGRVAPDASMIASSIDILAELDIIFAKARLGRAMHAVPPKLNNRGCVRLMQARHPLIDADKVVANDLWIGQDFRVLVVTGPNTGGKTVTLKTIGLLSLMAQAGLQIPAKYGSEISVFDEIFADIGDEQSIEQSLSTFSSHMTNIVDILQNVTDHSLALFDELGAGTDPTEGAALAMTILEHLLNRGVTTMATTHYSELKAFALGTIGVENASVEFNVETLRPTYRLSIGIPGKSNAFEISRKLGLPDDLIQAANERLSKEQIRFEDVIANAEYHRQIAEKERELAEQAHLETQRLRNEAEKLKQELDERRETEIKKAKADARKLLLKAQRESEQVIQELKKMRSGQIREHEVQALRGVLNDAISDTAEKIQAAPADDNIPATLAPGDTVMLINLNTRATVLSAPDAKGEVSVQAGAMKMKVKLADTRIAEPEAKSKAKPKKSSSFSPAAREVKTECDVRGMTKEEALSAVDLFIDAGILNKLKTLYIIHGKGTGVLRSGIQNYLKHHRMVAEFRLGHYGEGEDGVTVVTLK